MRIQNGILMTMENGTFSNGYVDFENGIITGCGDLKDAPTYDGEILDAAGGYILPGLIDAHSHIGICEEGAGKSGSDCNETITPVTPDMRAMDGINPRDSAIIKSRKAGVTVAGISPGSGNVICGQVAAVKLRGDNIREMVVKAPAAMKMAVGENPKRVYGEKGKSPKTRMAIAAILRKNLTNAQRYAAKKARGEDVYDPELEALIPVVNGEIPAHIHAHEADDIQTAIRIAQEFGLDYSIIHATGAKHVAAEMAAEGKIPSLARLRCG